MSKFDPDFAIFGTLAADISEDSSIGESVINYTNAACTRLFGDLNGKTILELFSSISGSVEEGRILLEKFMSEGLISFEGTLNEQLSDTETPTT